MFKGLTVQSGVNQPFGQKPQLYLLEILTDELSGDLSSFVIQRRFRGLEFLRIIK